MDQEPVKIFVVFVNFNNGEDIMYSCRQFLPFKEVRGIVVVDNGSTDGSLQKLLKVSRKNRKLLIIQNRQNFGFGKAANMGIKKALAMGADRIALLNPDLVFEPSFLDKLVANKADLVQVALKFQRGRKWIYDFGGKINWVLGRTYHLETTNPTNRFEYAPIDYVSGGATLIKSSVFEKIGFFDEGYFLYYEDVDFSLRARAAGFKLTMDRDIIVEHKLEIAKQTHNLKKIRWNLESNQRFIFKWVPWYFKLPALLFLWLVKLKSNI